MNAAEEPAKAAADDCSGPLPTGPHNYAERRLLDITKAADVVAFWVRVWGVLGVIVVAVVVVLLVAKAS